jgi:hypothetical protein
LASSTRPATMSASTFRSAKVAKAVSKPRGLRAVAKTARHHQLGRQFRQTRDQTMSEVRARGAGSSRIRRGGLFVVAAQHLEGMCGGSPPARRTNLPAASNPALSAFLRFKKQDPSRGSVGWGLFSDGFRRLPGMLRRTRLICDKSMLHCEDQIIGTPTFRADRCSFTTIAIFSRDERGPQLSGLMHSALGQAPARTLEEPLLRPFGRLV